MSVLPWTADVVLARLLSPDDMKILIQMAERETSANLRGDFAMDFERKPEWGACTFQYDRRDNIRHLQIAGLQLAPGITYQSKNDRQYCTAGMGSDQTGYRRVVFEACVRVANQTPPETILNALTGRHVSAVIEHPSLVHPDLTIKLAVLNGRPGEWNSFSMLLETVIVDVGIGKTPE